MSSFNGVCHCGATEWTATLDKEQQGHILCHCDTCKILSGGTYTLNQIIPKSALKITKGANAIKSYTYKGDSGNDVNCYYCPNCTTHVYHHQTVAGPDTIVLRTGVLTEGRKNFEPKAEIFGKDRLGWEKEVAHTFPVLPPN
ncbi:Mss4-like protein [Delphinella strobiligena]|nr:Mss4-like protein [Delphinella strobiligena]